MSYRDTKMLTLGDGLPGGKAIWMPNDVRQLA
jgi:hypothetical protein